MHRTLNHCRVPCACTTNCHSPSVEWVSGILMELCSSTTEGNLKASSSITEGISGPAFWHFQTALWLPSVHVTKKMNWQHQSPIHWDDVSRYILIGAQNIAGYGTCSGLGRSKIETRTEPLHETPIKVPSTSLNYLGTCQKYQCSAFKRKML